MNCRATSATFALIVCLTSVLGCGPSTDTRRKELHGRVTFNGQPVPVGIIHFDPDASKGNEGPQGAADIRDGKYVTHRGFGAVTGPHIVRITGYDGKAPSGPTAALRPQGEMLFANHEALIDISAGANTFDFDVIAEGK